MNSNSAWAAGAGARAAGARAGVRDRARAAGDAARATADALPLRPRARAAGDALRAIPGWRARKCVCEALGTRRVAPRRQRAPRLEDTPHNAAVNAALAGGPHGSKRAA